jgi:hypothetical protein
MSDKQVKSVHRVTALVAPIAILFCIFFQVNKGGPLGDINPFAVDPYDAVGSFGIQVALLVGILTYARALRWLVDPAQAGKARFILRGNALVLATVWVTLLTDAAAMVLHPPAPSYWGRVLGLELALMFALTAVCTSALAVVWRVIPTAATPGGLTPADAIDDLWALVRGCVNLASAISPAGLVKWVNRWSSDQLFAGLPWLNPRTHPWRFAIALGLLVGVGLVLAQLQEGLPPNLATGLLVAGIFLVGELTATVVGFAVLGRYLGLRS